MRLPKKTDFIYKTLKNDILSGKLTPGMQLPPEVEFARKLNVGRVTLRSALDRLQKESLVKRVERKGTFVRLQPQMPSLTLLIPCENYVEKSGYGSIMTTQMILNGMIFEAQCSNYQVRTLAVSKSNDINDIDYDALNTLNENSSVVIFGAWYKPIFEFIVNKKCNVVNITALSNYDDKFKKITADWNFVHFGLEDTWEKAAKLLKSKGCKKVVYATNAPHAPSAIKTGYERVFPKNSKSFDFTKQSIFYENFCVSLQKFYEEYQFDGLLLNYTNFSHIPQNNFGLPPEVKIIMELSIGVDAPDFAEYFRCPMYEAGRQAAQMLIKNIRKEIKLLPVKINSPSFEVKIPDIIL